MDAETLRKANDLNQKINECKEALGTFEWLPYIEGQQKKASLNPRIIIEYDGDGREEMALPFNLNNSLIDFLKNEIIKELEEAERQFKDLKC